MSGYLIQAALLCAGSLLTVIGNSAGLGKGLQEVGR